tara:strand:+ start:1167 stop:1298 length:132 start_codon:yes stop_codon:yes gene_type:complete
MKLLVKRFDDSHDPARIGMLAGEGKDGGTVSMGQHQNMTAVSA